MAARARRRVVRVRGRVPARLGEGRARRARGSRADRAGRRSAARAGGGAATSASAAAAAGAADARAAVVHGAPGRGAWCPRGHAAQARPAEIEKLKKLIHGATATAGWGSPRRRRDRAALDPRVVGSGDDGPGHRPGQQRGAGRLHHAPARRRRRAHRPRDRRHQGADRAPRPEGQDAERGAQRDDRRAPPRAAPRRRRAGRRPRDRGRAREHRSEGEDPRRRAHRRALARDPRVEHVEPVDHRDRPAPRRRRAHDRPGTSLNPPPGDGASSCSRSCAASTPTTRRSRRCQALARRIGKTSIVVAATRPASRLPSRLAASPSAPRRCALLEAGVASWWPTSIARWSSATATRWARSSSPISSASTCGSRSSNTCTRRSANSSGRPRSCVKWCAPAASARRRARASTSGRPRAPSRSRGFR